MKKSVISFFLSALLSVAFIPQVNVYSQAGDKAKANYTDNEILVKFKDNIEPLADREQIAREIFPVIAARDKKCRKGRHNVCGRSGQRAS